MVIQSGESKTIQDTFDKDKISGTYKTKRRRIGWNGKHSNYFGTIIVSGGGEKVTFNTFKYK